MNSIGICASYIPRTEREKEKEGEKLKEKEREREISRE